MRTALTLAAAVVINVSALAAWEWNVTEQVTPAGEVTIVQLERNEGATPAASVAQAQVDGHAEQTANSL